MTAMNFEGDLKVLPVCEYLRERHRWKLISYTIFSIKTQKIHLTRKWGKMPDKVLILRSFKLSMNQKLSIFPAQFEHLTLNLFNCCETNSLSLNHGWLLNEKQFTPLVLQSCLSCRSVSVSCECCSSLKYLIFGTKLDRTKKSPYQLLFPTFLCLLLFNLAFVISTNKVKNT